MLAMALEIAMERPAYEDIATKVLHLSALLFFFHHFFNIFRPLLPPSPFLLPHPSLSSSFLILLIFI